MSHTSKKPDVSADTDVLFQNCTNFNNAMRFSIKAPPSFSTFSLYQALITLQILGFFYYL